MKLEEMCVSLNMAKKLEELGVNQYSQFYWHCDNGVDYVSYGNPIYCMCKYKTISAFTASELGDLLPFIVIGEEHTWNDNEYRLSIIKGKASWVVAYEGGGKIKCNFIGNTLPDAMAQMLINLIESKQIEVESPKDTWIPWPPATEVMAGGGSGGSSRTYGEVCTREDLCK